MRSYTNFFRVNGNPMLAPDQDVEMTYNDLDSSESGRDEGGFMHRIVLRHNVQKWAFVYNALSKKEMQYMESIFPIDAEFDFTHPDRTDPTKMVTTRCYRSNYSIGWRNAVTGDYRNYKFNIVEC